jgi:transposase-like protein
VQNYYTRPRAQRPIYLAFGVNLFGRKEVLGLWAAETEGAKFWLQVAIDLSALLV